MHTTFLKWSNNALVLLVLIAGCTPASIESWSPITGIDGGFSVNMPVANDVQQGEMRMGEDELVTRIAIAADSGVTYVASWFDLPERFRTGDPDTRIEAAWSFVIDRSQAELMPVRGPLGDDTADMRNAWLLKDNEIRMGVVLVLRDMRVIILNSAAPQFHYNESVQLKMDRFFRSLVLE